MVICDTLFVIGWFVPTILLNYMTELEFNDTSCKALQGVSFFGRAGSSTFIVVLAIERNAALRFPKRLVLRTNRDINLAELMIYNLGLIT